LSQLVVGIQIDEVIAEGQKTERRISCSSNCKIELLEKFFMIFELHTVYSKTPVRRF